MQWLNDPERTFAEGLEIYKANNGMDKNYEFFHNATNPMPGGLHFNLLIDRLRVLSRKQTSQPDQTDKVIKAVGPAISVQRIKYPGKLKIVANDLVDVKELPENLQKLYFANKDLVKTISGAHAALKSAKTDDERSKQMTIALEAEEKKYANWRAIDTWWKENKEGKQPTALTENKAKRQETVRKAILRAKKEIKDGNLSPKQKKAREEKIATWNQELKDLKGD